MQPGIQTQVGMVKLNFFYGALEVYSSGQSHFSEIDVKLTEKNKFVTHFVQKCLEMHENEQNVILYYIWCTTFNVFGIEYYRTEF